MSVQDKVLALLEGLEAEMRGSVSRVRSGSEIDLGTGVALADIAPAQAEAVWRALVDRARLVGIYPVILDQEGKQSFEDNEDDDDPVITAAEFDVDAMLVEQREWKDLDNEEGRHYWLPEDDDDPVWTPADAQFWPEVQGDTRMRYWGDRPFIAFVSAPTGWAAAALLGWSEGNGHSAPEHAAMLRRWEEAHGARLARIGPASADLLLSEPVHDRDTAVEIAVEQALYADTVGYGEHDTVNEMAAAILTGTVWHFWWD
jgi:hypothetical protein